MIINLNKILHKNLLTFKNMMENFIIIFYMKIVLNNGFLPMHHIHFNNKTENIR